MEISNTLVIILIFIIILLEYKIQKKQLGIIILHNNDHTLNKIVQYITSFFEKLEQHFTIIIIKEEKSKKNNERSTGRLFNIGYRQLSKLDGYLFIDSKYCKLDSYYNLLVKPTKLTNETIYPKNKIEVIDNLCGVFISREYFKKIDGFSNSPNNNFGDFLKSLEGDKKAKEKYGGYLSTNLGIKYNIVERTPITTNAIRIVIKLYVK
jgi:hypothetical protein